MTEIKYIAFDTETEMMSYLNPVPDLICLTHAVAGDLRGTIKTPWEHDIENLVRNFWKDGIHTPGHYISYDLSVLAFKYPDLLPDIFAALDAGLIHDTLLREKLLNITRHGTIDMLEINGANIRLGYSLSDLEKKYLNIDRSDLKDNEDAPRTNYAIYKNIPLAKWDELWITYAIDDAINTGLVFMRQEEERRICIDTTGYDPFVTEAMRMKFSFALRLIECTGSLLDGDKVKEVAEEFTKEYDKPELRLPLIKAGLVTEPVPPQPYAKGTLEHLPTCFGHKDHIDYKKSRKVKDCGCPVKMKAGEPEHWPQKPLFKYVWNLAGTNPNVKAWPTDGYISTLKQAEAYDAVIADGAFRKEVILSTNVENTIKELEARKEEALQKGDKDIANWCILELVKYCVPEKYLIPDDVTLQVNEEWIANYAAFDPLLSLYAERKAIRKIITDYLPKMHYDDGTGNLVPAKIIRGSYNALVLTGRCSCRTTDKYPSRNDQNVDPRVRPCTIPRPGNIIVSTDINGMELGTLAQKCVNLFGKSELANKINAGIDTHAFLAAQIAFAMDKEFAGLCAFTNGQPDAVYDVFKETKTMKESCEEQLKGFTAVYKQGHPDLDRPVLWSDFFKHYRTMAKPTGLGYPGGLGAATFISYAKATFGLILDLETAQQLKELWLSTYPEMGQYLEYVGKCCKDPQHSVESYIDEDGKEQKRTFYCYDTPRGMHRAKCSFCECANGQALQAFSAEGALEGLYKNTKAFWLSGYPIEQLQKTTDRPEWQTFVQFMSNLGGLLNGCYIIAFIHDEILWESPEDKQVGKRAKVVESMVIASMEEVTPDVKAGAESAAMHRWYKKAEPVKDGDNLIAWEPEHV